MLKNLKNNWTEEIGLVTPTPVRTHGVVIDAVVPEFWCHA